MGNNNTIFGYSEQLIKREDHTTLVSGVWVQSFDTVPAGEVWIVTGMSYFSDNSSGTVNVYGRMPAAAIGLADTQTWTANQHNALPLMRVILKEGDNIEFSWAGLAASQRLISNIWGYIMEVEA